MQLVDKGQPVVEDGIQRRAKNKGQRKTAQPHPKQRVVAQPLLPQPVPDAQQQQQQGQNTKIDAPLHVILDAPLAGSRQRHVNPRQRVHVALMGRIAKKAGQRQRHNPAQRKAPATHLRQRGRPLPKINLANLKQGNQLHRPQHQPQPHHPQQPTTGPQQNHPA